MSKDFSEILTPFFNDLSFERRTQCYRLCASVLRKLQVEVKASHHGSNITVSYMRKDFSSICHKFPKNKVCAKSPLLLKTIECTFNMNFIYYLIKRTYDELFVIHDMSDEPIELLKTEKEESFLLIESAFAYAVNEE